MNLHSVDLVVIDKKRKKERELWNKLNAADFLYSYDLYSPITPWSSPLHVTPWVPDADQLNRAAFITNLERAAVADVVFIHRERNNDFKILNKLCTSSASVTEYACPLTSLRAVIPSVVSALAIWRRQFRIKMVTLPLVHEFMDWQKKNPHKSQTYINSTTNQWTQFQGFPYDLEEVWWRLF